MCSIFILFIHRERHRQGEKTGYCLQTNNRSKRFSNEHLDQFDIFSPLNTFFSSLFCHAGMLNQHNWGKRYPSCNSARQSPVDIEETFTQVRLQYQNLQLEGWDKLTAETSTIHNNGKTGWLILFRSFFSTFTGETGF